MTEQITRKPDSHLLDEIRTRIDHWLDRFANALTAAADFLDGHSWLVLPTLLLPYVFVLHHWRMLLFWYDELFTYYIAQAPSFHTMWQWTHQIDLNPPLYYVAVRILFKTFHPSVFLTRLPSVVAYFVAAICAYELVRYRLTPSYGLIASFILFGSSYNLYAYEARPYSFILCFLGVVAVGWQRAIDHTGFRRFLSLLAVIAGGFCLLLSHVLALVPYAALLFAEFIRSTYRRKVDLALAACLVLPLSVCALYVPLIYQHSSGVYPAVYQASVEALFKDYAEMWTEIAPFLATIVLLATLLRRAADPPEASLPMQSPSRSELIFFFCLLLVPLAVILDFLRSHSQFFPRYGIPAILAVAVLTPFLIAWWTQQSRRAAAIGVIICLFLIVRPSYIARALQRHVQPAGTSNSTREQQVALNRISPDLPFVDADGLTFVEMNFYENSSFLKRVYYLIDPEAAYKYAHGNGFNGLPSLIGKFPIQANIESYKNFIQKNHKFILFGNYDTPDDWLLNKLIADNDTVRFLGKFQSRYADHEVYEVTLKNP